MLNKFLMHFEYVRPSTERGGRRSPQMDFEATDRGQGT